MKQSPLTFQRILFWIFWLILFPAISFYIRIGPAGMMFIILTAVVTWIIAVVKTANAMKEYQEKLWGRLWTVKDMRISEISRSWLFDDRS